MKRLGGDRVTTPSMRTPDQTQVARFWVESSPQAWNRIARTVATSRHLNVMGQARLYALLDMGMSDGYVATFDTKYHYGFWRPVTAIQLADTDGNPRTVADPDLDPAGVDPGHPGL